MTRATSASSASRRPWFWRLTAELVALYALILLFVDDWHHGVVALIAVAATPEACRG